MSQIKAIDVNWLDQAWRISAVIADMPCRPRGGLLADGKKWPNLTGNTKQLIELLQDTIALHLAYRLRVVHKHKVILQDGQVGMFMLYDRNPTVTRKVFTLLGSKGVRITGADLWALDAHMKLGRILIDRYVCEEWKRQLPLIVASIGGQSVSQTAKLKATQPRPRPPNRLREEKIRAIELHPNDDWKRLLTRLQKLDIVYEWDATSIQWANESGDVRTTSVKTFQNWK